MTAAERLQRAEELVSRLWAEGRDLDPERKAKLESLRRFAVIERVIPDCRIVHPTDIGAADTKAPKRSEIPCLCCGRRSWWRSIHDAVVCGRCHPPVSAAWSPHGSKSSMPDTRASLSLGALERLASEIPLADPPPVLAPQRVDPARTDSPMRILQADPRAT